MEENRASLRSRRERGRVALPTNARNASARARFLALARLAAQPVFDTQSLYSDTEVGDLPDVDGRVRLLSWLHSIGHALRWGMPAPRRHFQCPRRPATSPEPSCPCPHSRAWASSLTMPRTRTPISPLFRKPVPQKAPRTSSSS